VEHDGTESGVFFFFFLVRVFVFSASVVFVARLVARVER